MIKIVTVCFDYGRSDIYRRMHKVLLYSIEKHMDDACVISNWLPEPKPTDRIRAYVSNTVKLEKWKEEFYDSEPGDRIAFLDCDLLVINDFSGVFENQFDIAYTYREDSKWPLNGGVFFCRVNEKTKQFMNTFTEVNDLMFFDEKFHRPWKQKYGGINQAALGYMLESGNHDCNILPLPCSTWNVCDEPYDLVNSKILHFKSGLRSAMFSGLIPECYQGPVELWKQYEAEMMEDSLQRNPEVVDNIV